jgi:hypothetical protein
MDIRSERPLAVSSDFAGDAEKVLWAAFVRRTMTRSFRSVRSHRSYRSVSLTLLQAAAERKL